MVEIDLRYVLHLSVSNVKALNFWTPFDSDVQKRLCEMLVEGQHIKRVCVYI